MLTTKQRAFLRAQATSLDAVFQIGKGGVNENMLKSIEDALAAHEMVKIKCLENCEYTAREAMDGISEALDAEQVQVIGNKFVLFKISPKHRRYDLDKLCLIDDDKKKTSKKTAQKPAQKTGAKTAKKPAQKPAYKPGKPSDRKSAQSGRPGGRPGAQSADAPAVKAGRDYRIEKKK